MIGSYVYLKVQIGCAIDALGPPYSACPARFETTVRIGVYGMTVDGELPGGWTGGPGDSPETSYFCPEHSKAGTK